MSEVSRSARGYLIAVASALMLWYAVARVKGNDAAVAYPMASLTAATFAIPLLVISNTSSSSNQKSKSLCVGWGGVGGLVTRVIQVFKEARIECFPIMMYLEYLWTRTPHLDSKNLAQASCGV